MIKKITSTTGENQGGHPLCINGVFLRKQYTLKPHPKQQPLSFNVAVLKINFHFQE